MQYSRFFVVFGCSDEAVEPFWKYIAVLPHPPYTKTKLGKNSGYTTRVHLVFGHVWFKESPQTANVSQTFLSIIEFKEEDKENPVKPENWFYLQHLHPKACPNVYVSDILYDGFFYSRPSPH